MARARWRSMNVGVGAVALLAISIAAFSRAADKDIFPEENSRSHPATSLSDAPVARPQRVIVLLTGRVVLGDVVDRPGGYLVRENFGSVVVPFAQVRLTAADLPDAYRKLSRSLTTPTAGKHLELARWCYQNRLYGSAQHEVKRALLLEPARKDAREFLRKLQRTMETGVHSGQTSTNRADAPLGPTFPGQSWKSQLRQRRAVRQREAPVSVSGLSPQTVQMFVQKVQPLLINSCGNARCHGQAATSDFRLTPVNRGMSGFRTFTEQNLSSVLREIDDREPTASPLLTIPQGTHGGSRKPLFIGPSAKQQQALLHEWVLRAATEHGKQQFAHHTPPTANPDQQVTSKQPSTPRRDPFLRQILAEERPDAFDPEVFNRIIHANSPASNRLR